MQWRVRERRSCSAAEVHRGGCLTQCCFGWTGALCDAEDQGLPSLLQTLAQDVSQVNASWAAIYAEVLH